MDRLKYLKILRDKYTQIANDDSVQGAAKTNAIDMIAFINRTLQNDDVFNLPAPDNQDWTTCELEGITGEPPMPCLFAEYLQEVM